VWLVLRSRSAKQVPSASSSSPAVDAFVRTALGKELARGVAGLRGGTDAERRALEQTLKGDPDVRVVSAIEDAVSDVELEYVRYAHEPDAELSLRVKYEDGTVGTEQTRIPLSDLPVAVREAFETGGPTRVFRPWPLPWR
jgi:hypothetical protein